MVSTSRRALWPRTGMTENGQRPCLHSEADTSFKRRRTPDINARAGDVHNHMVDKHPELYPPLAHVQTSTSQPTIDGRHLHAPQPPFPLTIDNAIKRRYIEIVTSETCRPHFKPWWDRETTSLGRITCCTPPTLGVTPMSTALVPDLVAQSMCRPAERLPDSDMPAAFASIVQCVCSTLKTSSTQKPT